MFSKNAKRAIAVDDRVSESEKKKVAKLYNTRYPLVVVMLNQGAMCNDSFVNVIRVTILVHITYRRLTGAIRFRKHTLIFRVSHAFEIFPRLFTPNAERKTV